MPAMLTVLDQLMVIVASLLFLAVGWAIGIRIEIRRQQAAKLAADDIRAEAERYAESVKKAKIQEAVESIERDRSEVKREAEEVRSAQHRLKEELDKRESVLEAKEKQHIEREHWLSNQQIHLDAKEERLSALETDLNARSRQLSESEIALRASLERQAEMTSEEAKAALFEKVENENRLALARSIRQAEMMTKEEAARRARRIITLAIQKYASEQVIESTINVVNLPSEEMKGRIIGREGRNIRVFENLTGADVIVDDTPETVLLSCFDPVRREISRRAVEKLIADGRIRPAKIEEMVAASRLEVEEIIASEGDKAALEAGVLGLHHELIKLLGRLRFRTSYGQNMLSHSLEVSFLAAQMAAELGANVQAAARAGLLHDIGKAVTGSMDGPHAVVGARCCEKYGESAAVVHCVEAHHEDVEQKTIEAMLVQAADAISAARPGARRENIEDYIKRLENIEKIGHSFEGVDQVYAVQAGREVRVFVNPGVVDDLGAAQLANKIAARIDEEIKSPGMVLVTVVRESRHQAKII
ncbi:MAG: ribonuclease Y [Candidatus Bruticola sp.]